MTALSSSEGRSASSPSVLVVEDHLETRIFLEAALEEQFDVVAHAQASAALAIAERQAFDLLVFDISLGGDEDGVGLLRQVRALPDYAEVPALAVTAYAQPRDRQRYLEAGFDAYLSKPFFQDDILRMASHLLSSSSRTDASPTARDEAE
jgi:CheY-like chemotaxis protein